MWQMPRDEESPIWFNKNGEHFFLDERLRKGQTNKQTNILYRRNRSKKVRPEYRIMISRKGSLSKIVAVILNLSNVGRSYYNQ